MKYLVLAVFSDGSNVATHSKEFDCGFDSPEDRAEDIINSIADSGLGKTNLWEVFVYKSAQNFGDAPEQVAYWAYWTTRILFTEKAIIQTEEPLPEEPLPRS